MPTRFRASTPEGQSVLQAILKAQQNGFSSLYEKTDPLQETLQGAVYRATSLERKQVPISPQEKLAAFRLMGFDATQKQLDIATDTHRFRVVRAGRRSGKTTLAAHEAVAVMIAKPGSNGWVVAPDYELAFRCWEIMVDELDRLEARGLIKYRTKATSTSNMRIVLDNGSVCEGKSCENAEDLQGAGLDWLIIDEVGIVLPFVFTQFLRPALSDRRGWAFFIGTPIGENWTEKEVRHQKRLAQAANVPCDWSEHLFPMWANTKMFPEGRLDPEIQELERSMSFEEFMEQVCASPQKSRYVTYKEFDEAVHIRSCPFNPDLPVQISIDPSTGVNPYAVGVFQDYGEYVTMIDEYYRLSVLATDVVEDLSRRAWWPNVNEAIMDDNWPQERESWRRQPMCRFTVTRAGKSMYIADSIPTVRSWLRDPLKYNVLTQPIRDEMQEKMYPDRAWEDLEVEDQTLLNNRRDEIASQDKTLLFDCARLFFDKRCVNMASEMTTYVYKKRRRDDQNVSETPQDHNNHLADCLRYFIHKKKRQFGSLIAKPESYLDGGVVIY